MIECIQNRDYLLRKKKEKLAKAKKDKYNKNGKSTRREEKIN